MLTMLADLQLDSSEASATHEIGGVLAPYAFPGPDHNDNDIALFQIHV